MKTKNVPLTLVTMFVVCVVFLLLIIIMFYIDKQTMPFYCLILQLLFLLVLSVIMIMTLHIKTSWSGKDEFPELSKKIDDLSVSFRSVSMVFALLFPLGAFLGYQKIEDFSEKYFEMNFKKNFNKELYSIQGNVSDIDQKLVKLESKLKSLDSQKVAIENDVNNIKLVIVDSVRNKIGKKSLYLEQTL